MESVLNTFRIIEGRREVKERSEDERREERGGGEGGGVDGAAVELSLTSDCNSLLATLLSNLITVAAEGIL